MDAETINRLVSFLSFLEECPRVRGSWLERFLKYCRHGVDKDLCPECLKEVAGGLKG